METSKGEIQFPELFGWKVIIVVAGQPCTGKAQIAECIGKWAGCQVCYADDFLRTLSLEKQYTVSSPPSGEEGERIHRLALDALYSVAFRHLTHYTLGPGECVVIKSRLSSTFELDLLLKLFKRSPNDTYRKDYNIIIVECRIQNEYQWRSHVGHRLELWPLQEEEWYKVRSWKDIENAKEDCVDSHYLDLHLHSSLLDIRPPSYSPRNKVPYITRLVLDYYDDFNPHPEKPLIFGLTRDFQRALKYILKKQMRESKEYRRRATYVAQVQLKDMRRYLLEMELDSSPKRREYLCTLENCIVECCLFKYRKELELPGDEAEFSCCGVCDKKMVLGEPAYTCHFCILNLHSSCAEMPLNVTLLGRVLHDSLFSFFSYKRTLREVFLEKQITCKSCNVHGKDSGKHYHDCVSEMHLSCGVSPTIIKHDCHQLHFLSMKPLSADGKACNACGSNQRDGGYVCHICNLFYDMICIFLPEEVKQKHGGHEHVLKLMYSHEGMDQEDDHWCNDCYKDIDPQNWFYSCQDCPYYVTHAREICVGSRRMLEALRNGNLPIQQLRDKSKSL